MDTYDVILLILGAAFLGAATLPYFLSKIPVSLPMVYVFLGMLLARTSSSPFQIDPVEHSLFTERLAEMAVIISLMSAGLKLDRPVGWRSWNSTWRLLAVTMPLCIGALAFGGVWVMGLPLAAALLLGAVIAPTDPVLASRVQVGPPGEGSEDEPRFALTSEAGLNDGLAFPFVNLAVVVAATGLAPHGLTRWLMVDVGWKILAGGAAGALIGHCVALLVFRCTRPKVISDGFVAVALTLLVYGATEIIHGYGFIGVFVAAVMFRRYERGHAYHRSLHDFSEQVERLFLAATLMLFGAAITHGLFNALTSPAALLGALFVLFVRPLTGLLGLAGLAAPRYHRGVTAMFGIRGIGTFYYLAHGLNQGDFTEPQARAVWAAAGFIVLVSVIVHGTTESFAMEGVKFRRA